MSAQLSNGSYAIVQDVVSSAGGQIGGGNPMQAQTALGLPASGRASNGTFTLVGGMGGIPEPLPIRGTIDVSGTIDASAVSVTVNGKAGTIASSTFTVLAVPLALGPNTLTATAKDAAGNEGSHAITVYLDLPAEQKESRFNILVQGTVNDPSAQVRVNGVVATVTSGQFTVKVPAVSGYNTLTATATDQAGKQASHTIGVFVFPPDKRPPMPTVGTVGAPLPQVTTSAALTFGGTKTAGTSIWINGQQVYALDSSTTWTVTLTLVEGDNDFEIVARDATGASSAKARVNVILDNLPPVVTCAPPAKTNFNPYLLTGTVDDSRTTVTLTNVTLNQTLSAIRSRRNFEVNVPLALGPNTLRLVAISPNGHQTSRDYAVELGTIPTVQAIQPADGNKLYSSTAVTIQITAVDRENDAIEYQTLAGPTVLCDWNASPSCSWSPSLSQLGLRVIRTNVRDAYGGMNSMDAEEFVLRRPIQHP